MEPAPARAADLLAPRWSPLADVERGYARLDPDARAMAAARVRALGRKEHLSPRVLEGDPEPFRLLFSFLAHVEVVGIEVPLRFLDEAPPAARADLMRQLEDEVVHALVFARLADALGGVEPPVPAMERLLEVIRAPADLAIGKTLLNLLAEGWIEALLDQATEWDVAPKVLAAIKADETRHVHQAVRLATDVDREKLRAEVDRLEQALVGVLVEPRIALVILSVAGSDAFARFASAMLEAHRAHLAEIGMEPTRLRAFPASEGTKPDARARGSPKPVAPGAWRAASMALWDPPADPTMAGYVDLRIGHLPRRALTAALVAILGEAWAKDRRFNRVLARGRVWELPHVDVAVRVALDAAGEHVSTVVVPDADKLSLADISVVLREGVRALSAAHRAGDASASGWSARERWRATRKLADHLPPDVPRASVALSNVGKFGLQMGTGAMLAPMAPSTELFVGERRRLPVWRGVMYLPATHVTIGCLQDHRVHDGAAAGLAMRALRQASAPASWRKIAARPDTLRDEDSLRSAMVRATPVRGVPSDLAPLLATGVVKVTEAEAAAIATLLFGTGSAAGAGITYAIMKSREKREEAPPERKPDEAEPKE